jgi:hypothetical protein
LGWWNGSSGGASGLNWGQVQIPILGKKRQEKQKIQYFLPGFQWIALL